MFASATRRVVVTALAFGAFGLASGSANAETGTTTDRYTLVHGCFALESAAGDLIAQTGDGYSATAGSLGAAEAFRMQATDLGKYLFYGEAQDFLGLDDATLPSDEVVVATAPSGRSNWTVDGSAGEFTIVNKAAGLALAIDNGGQVVSTPEGQAETFTFVPANGCATYPEISLNTTGEPNTGSPAYGEVEGTIDGHMHMMAFEFLGGQAHCGEPWHKFGAPVALQDCPDHTASDGCGAALETFLGGSPCHETAGYPEFTDWPDSESLTHESSYYKWLERAHQGGLRVFVNLLVENRVLCEVYPDMSATHGGSKNSCNEMDSVLLQAQRLNELQDYIDAQEGGPGEGWFRISRSPFKARKQINKGNLAVVMGMEVSEPFNCRLRGGPGELLSSLEPGLTPEPLPTNHVDSRCTEQGITDWLDQLRQLGVRQMEITNKFDNALTGVAGDGGPTGVVINNGQFGKVGGEYWDFGPYVETCDQHNHDRVPATGGTPVSQDEIFGNGLAAFGIPNILQLYGPDDKCNQLGLSSLGEHAIEGIIDRKMIFDPDHMSERARGQALDLIEDRDYPGIISSHTWSTDSTLPRVFGLGGFITPYAGGSSSFASAWEQVKSSAVRDELGDQYFGIGYGADANGFGSQGGPRNPPEESDVDYPFTGIDGAVTFAQQVSGNQEYDINVDGVDHYGLYPDWMEDLRKIKGQAITDDLNRGAEAYLQMWERAYGVPEVDCSQWGDEDFSTKGLGTELQLNKRTKRNLRKAGQPVERERTWRWCAGDDGRESALNVKAYFGPRDKMDFAVSNLAEHAIDGVGAGDSKTELRGVAKKISDDVFVSTLKSERAFVWIVDGGTVTHTGVASQRVTKKHAGLARRLARVATS